MIDEKLGTIRDSINEVKTNLGLETTDSLETLVDTSENAVIPTGTLSITENGVVDVKEYESANVNVSPDLGTKSITENGTYNASDDNVDGYSQVSVNVSGGSSQEDEIVERTISEYTNNRVSKIGSAAFYSYTSLTTVSFPQCTSIGNAAFSNCSSLTNISFPACTTIGSSAFYSCKSLTTVSFPVCTSIGTAAFNTCTSLTNISFPACTFMGSSVFQNCSSLTTASFPVCTRIRGAAFYSCKSLTTVSFPVCSYIEEYAFYGCTSLTTVSFPASITLGTSVFLNCTSLTTASFPQCIAINGSAFTSCYNLLSLYLLGSSVPRLPFITAFKLTPISDYTTSTGGIYGSIIVQPSMMEAFQTASNWSVYSSRFSAWNGTD